MVRNLTQPDLVLLAFAREAQEKSYAPYSRFRVGAAIYTADGETFQGCNYENAAPSAGLCAERAAIAAAVSAGYTDFSAIAIVGDSDAPTVPCGTCRQALSEFNPDMRVIMGGQHDDVMVMTLDELMPEPFMSGFMDQDETK